ncbi:MAG TPA: aegerolysin family protein [Thermoanaerobaculia bacterium]|jgi:hypothetical protein|nr:aegerolysin family protein [Thermoanaerobaculia bacterium]
MSGNNIATGQIVNNTPYDLYVANSGINSGHWKTTPVAVAKGTTSNSAFVAQGTSGTATGTSGWVQYSLQGAPTSIVANLAFDDPYSSSNSASGTNINTTTYVVIASVPSSGSQVTFTYTIGPPPSGQPT